MNLQGDSRSGREVVTLGKKTVVKQVKETIVQEMGMKVLQILLNPFLSVKERVCINKCIISKT